LVDWWVWQGDGTAKKYSGAEEVYADTIRDFITKILKKGTDEWGEEVMYR